MTSSILDFAEYPVDMRLFAVGTLMSAASGPVRGMGEFIKGVIMTLMDATPDIWITDSVMLGAYEIMLEGDASRPDPDAVGRFKFTIPVDGEQVPVLEVVNRLGDVSWCINIDETETNFLLKICEFKTRDLTKEMAHSAARANFLPEIAGGVLTDVGVNVASLDKLDRPWSISVNTQGNIRSFVTVVMTNETDAMAYRLLA